MQKIVSFILLSSADPAKVSLTLKGLAGFVIPVLMFYFGWDEGAAGEFFSQTVFFVSSTIALFGLARKLWLTANSRNMAIDR